MEIGLARGDALGECERITRLHQHVKAPALDFGLLVLYSFDHLARLAHGRSGSPLHRRTLPRIVGEEPPAQTSMCARSLPRSGERACGGVLRERPARPRRL